MSIPLCDCHLHTEYSGDATLPLEWVIAHRGELGLSGLCPTEHFDPAPTDPRFSHLDLDAIALRHDRVRREYPGLHLGMGLEVTYRPEAEETIRRVVSSHPFDLLIGSVHDLDGLYVRDWLVQEGIRALPLRERLAPVVDLTHRMVRSGLFSVVGHLDYVKRYLPGVTGASFLAMFRDEIAQILRDALAAGAVLEVNLAGLRHACREPFPSREILAFYRSLGGEAVTVGSDAHAVDHYRVPLEAGAALAQDSGLSVVDWRSLPRVPRAP